MSLHSLTTPTLLTILSVLCSEARIYNDWEDSGLNSIADYPEPGDGDGDTLLDLTDFSYVRLPGGSWCRDNLYLLVLVHSHPEHFKERELIRRTWGSVTNINGWRVKLVFLLGKYSKPPSRPPSWHKKARFSENKISIKSRSLNRNGFFRSSHYESEKYKTDAIDKLVLLESDLNDDIVQGNFVDNPQNLTYKHVMGYKWVSQHCVDKPAFVLKTDDNVFVETYHLFNFLTAVYGSDPVAGIVCDVVPAGTGPLHQTTERSPDSRPKYCNGAAYLITPSLIPKFLRATASVSPITLDDVYMTGLVREYLGISPFYLNQRYTYELDRPIKWVVSNKNQPLPFIFVVSNSKETRWPETVKKLWRKSEQVQHQQHQQFIK